MTTGSRQESGLLPGYFPKLCKVKLEIRQQERAPTSTFENCGAENIKPDVTDDIPVMANPDNTRPVSKVAIWAKSDLLLLDAGWRELSIECPLTMPPAPWDKRSGSPSWT